MSVNFNYKFNFIKAVKYRFFITGLSSVLIFFLPSISEAGDISGEILLVKSPFSIYAPLYPKNYAAADSIVTVPPGSEFKALKEVKGGYIVEGADGECFAPGGFFIYGRLAAKCANALKSKDFKAADFFKIELPSEIENSEFFFNNASKKSFYTLAFLLYLKNGAGYGGYEQNLKDYDDFMAEASKKGMNLSVIEALAAFLNSGRDSKGDQTAVCVKRGLTETAACALLSERKPVVLFTYINGSDGEIVVAYSINGREGFEKEIDCYIYGRGIQTFRFKEFETLLQNSSNLFMVLM
jgi:hypothetical protein